MEAETMSVFNSAADQMHFDTHTLRKKDTLMRDRDQILCLSLKSLATWSTSSLLTHAWYTKNSAVSKWLCIFFLSKFSLPGPPLSESQANTTGLSSFLTTRKQHEEKEHAGMGMNEVQFLDFILCLSPPTLYYSPTGRLHKQHQQILSVISV